MEVLKPAIILQDEEDDLLIYCMGEGASHFQEEKR